MFDFYSRSTGEQQSPVDLSSLHEGLTLIDRAPLERFCRKIHECASRAANAAGIKNCCLVLSSYGELPAPNIVAWKKIAPRNKSFALGQHLAMADQAVAWAKEPGRNVYIALALYPGGLGTNRRGRSVEALGVFGLGADLDCDKGHTVRPEDLPLPPTIVIGSSSEPTENFNLIWFFKRLYTVDEVRPVARALADLVADADGGTADPTHLWRVPGTLNWPKKSKVARGRPLFPQAVQLIACGPNI